MKRHSQSDGHWATLVEGLQASPQECYSAIEEAIHRREIPGVRASRVTYKEGGALSADRIYLRISRRMLAFDICAAPFGKAFFFSWWQRELPPSNGLGCLASLLALGGAGWLLRFAMRTRAAAGVPLTLLHASIVGALLFLLALWLIGTFIRRGFIFSEDGVLNLPLIGPLYAFLFQPQTYYKLDTTDMYQRAVHAAVMEVVDGTMSAKGLRALSDAARTPRLGGPLGP